MAGVRRFAAHGPTALRPLPSAAPAIPPASTLVAFLCVLAVGALARHFSLKQMLLRRHAATVVQCAWRAARARHLLLTSVFGGAGASAAPSGLGGSPRRRPRDGLNLDDCPCDEASLLEEGRDRKFREVVVRRHVSYQARLSTPTLWPLRLIYLRGSLSHLPRASLQGRPLCSVTFGITSLT